MKLALMAFVIETCLVRIFVSSWGLSALFVVLYCALLYVWQFILLKKQNTNKPEADFEDILRQDILNSTRKRQKQLYEVFPTIGATQNN